MKIGIIPSILEPTKDKFVERYNLVSAHCKLAQLDVLDGSFLPYNNFHDPDFIAGLHPGIAFEIHFMTTDVEEKLDDWNFPWVTKILFHHEAIPHPASLIEKIKAMGKAAAVVINPETDPEKILGLLDDVGCVQVMTIHPGQNGTPFVPESVDHIRRLRQLNKNLTIEVDGGINPDTLKICRSAGADLFVAGSYLAGDFAARLAELKFVLHAA